MSKAIRVFIVDDHPMVIDGLLGYLEDKSIYEIVGTASNGITALEKLEAITADIVLTDIQMPHMDGIDMAKELLRRRPDQKIVALTMFNEPQFIKRMLQIGVMGYVLKNAGKKAIHEAIEMVMNGGQYYSAEVTHVIMNKLRGVGQKAAVSSSPALTEREMEILHLVLKQQSNQEIAENLFISARTVEAHKRNLLEKTGSKNVAGLVLYAIDHQLFEDF
ncbi:MAG: response regulator transcription factor [Roseivirga sp.]|nr:response regulator transcription factor [Roseivirga sp.]